MDLHSVVFIYGRNQKKCSKLTTVVLLFMYLKLILLGTGQLEREADHSPRTSDEFKNA
jgi:cytochrome oxidase assembly protein ShyY1